MDSELTPREIQQRIRSGETPEQVAEAAGVSVDAISAFATPVLAERRHITSTALAAPVRHRGQPVPGGPLTDVVAHGLVGAGADPRAITWDAWRLPNRQWLVRGTLDAETADLHFDLAARFSTPQDEVALRWLGLVTPAPVDDPDAEPTVDLEDELALVNAVREQPDDVEDSGPIWRPGHPAAYPTGRRLQSVPSPVDPAEQSAQPTPAPEPEPAAELDGDYEVLPRSASDLDVLYDMLGAFNEDSVNIYEGLSDPLRDGLTEDARDAGILTPEPTKEPVAEETPNEEPPNDEPADDEPADEDAEQPSLLGEDQPASEPPAEKPRRRSRRASVPSWDEIMFGGPKK